METFYIVIGIVGLIFLALVTLLIILLVRQKNKKRTSIRIIKPNNRIRTKSFRGSMKEKFSVDGNTYTYDHKCEIKKGFGVDVFYYEGSPFPINFNTIDKTTSITSKNLDDLLKNDLIEKLFNNDKSADTIKMLIIGCLVLSGLVLLIVLLRTPSVTLSNTPENIALIEQAIRNVVR